MPRPQFSLKTLLWLTITVGAVFGGMAIQRQLDKPAIRRTRMSVMDDEAEWLETMVTRDGTEWHRAWVSPVESAVPTTSRPTQ